MTNGEIWLMRLDKVRPGVIVRSVPWLSEAHIVPITSTIRGLPSEIEIPDMRIASVANAQRLMLVPTDNFVRRIGALPADVFDDLALAVCTVLGC